MSQFSHRSLQAELIDAPDISFANWYICLHELNTINTYLGGHAITLRGVRALLPFPPRPITIAEIGCGGGDNLKAIYRWSRQQDWDIRFIGIDLNEACISFAQQNCREMAKTQFICADYRTLVFNGQKPDIIFSSLFCHHFSNEQLVEMLQWQKQQTKLGFFINDLQRHPIAFYSIRLLTRLFSHSYLVKNDAPVSVLRGFRANEWRLLLQQAGIVQYKIQWQWAFRYLVTVPHAPTHSNI